MEDRAKRMAAEAERTAQEAKQMQHEVRGDGGRGREKQPYRLKYYT